MYTDDMVRSIVNRVVQDEIEFLLTPEAVEASTLVRSSSERIDCLINIKEKLFSEFDEQKNMRIPCNG